MRAQPPRTRMMPAIIIEKLLQPQPAQGPYDPRVKPVAAAEQRPAAHAHVSVPLRKGQNSFPARARLAIPRYSPATGANSMPIGRAAAQARRGRGKARDFLRRRFTVATAAVEWLGCPGLPRGGGLLTQDDPLKRFSGWLLGMLVLGLSAPAADWPPF